MKASEMNWSANPKGEPLDRLRQLVRPGCAIRFEGERDLFRATDAVPSGTMAAKQCIVDSIAEWPLEQERRHVFSWDRVRGIFFPVGPVRPFGVGLVFAADLVDLVTMGAGTPVVTLDTGPDGPAVGLKVRIERIITEPVAALSDGNPPPEGVTCFAGVTFTGVRLKFSLGAIKACYVPAILPVGA